METGILNLLNEDIAALEPQNGILVCKFVLIIRGEELNLIFGLVSEYPYHANLVDHYCDRFEIPAAWLKKPDKVEILDENCNIKGGGWLEIDPVSRKLKFFGRSTAYGKFGRADLNYILTAHKLFSDFEVIVRH